MQSFVLKSIFVCSVLFLVVPFCKASTFANFDFVQNDVTQGFPGWYYSDRGDNSCDSYDASKLCSTPDVNGQRQSIYYYYNGYNTDHMGWMRWGFMDAGSSTINGGSLKFLFTGGAYDNNGSVGYSGLEVRSKSQFDDLIAQGQNPYSDRILPGDLTLYFSSNNSGNHFYPFSQLVGNDRLSVWVLHPDGGPYTYENQKFSQSYQRPEQLFSWYPFVNDSNGDHYYHDLSNINMGGWTHYIFDAHPLHNNGGDPNPYSYYRAGGSDYPGDAVSYFDNVNKFSLRGLSAKNTPSPSEMFIDEFEAYKVSQLENDETISGIGVGYNPSTKMFDIAFNDKYRCATDCLSTYEIRYSFSPITNTNYGSAILAKVTNFDRTKNNNNGIVYKPSSGYSQLWAALEVSDSDKANLIDGNTIYFAVKDISDRSAMLERDSYDEETVNVPGMGMVRRMDLVKTIDYKIYPAFRQLYFADQTSIDGHLGADYSKQLSVKGGQQPYVFQLSSGFLPNGLTLSADGEITGTPTVVGTFNFSVNVQENSSFAQNITKEFTINIYNQEVCSDGVDNDADSEVDCADSDCYSSSSCSVTLVDFGSQNIFKLPSWNILLKDVYTNYVAGGPGGMGITIGRSGQYNYQGVQGSSKLFNAGDRILAYWYNNGSSAITFTPKISFNDNDRPTTGFAGTWNLMSEVTALPQETVWSEFVFDESSMGTFSLLNTNVNYDNSQELICDKISLVPLTGNMDIIASSAPSGLTVR